MQDITCLSDDEDACNEGQSSEPSRKRRKCEDRAVSSSHAGAKRRPQPKPKNLSAQKLGHMRQAVSKAVAGTCINAQARFKSCKRNCMLDFRARADEILDLRARLRSLDKLDADREVSWQHG